MNDFQILIIFTIVFLVIAFAELYFLIKLESDIKYFKNQIKVYNNIIKNNSNIEESYKNTFII